MPLASGSFQTHFIDANDITNQGIPSDSIEPGILKATIKLVHDVYLQELLGTSLMGDLQTKKVNNTLNSDETTLIDMYIKDVLINYAILEGAFFTSYKFQNKGIERMSGNQDNSAAATLNEIQTWQAKYKNYAEHYADRLTEYLRSHYTLFPAYRLTTFLSGDVQPLRTGYTSGIYLGTANENRHHMCRIHQCYYSQCNCNY
jgi:hypothetical protein